MASDGSCVLFCFVLGVILLLGMGGAKTVLYVYIYARRQRHGTAKKRSIFCVRRTVAWGHAPSPGNVMLPTIEAGSRNGKGLCIHLDALAASHSIHASIWFKARSKRRHSDRLVAARRKPGVCLQRVQYSPDIAQCNEQQGSPGQTLAPVISDHKAYALKPVH